jgi:hypothetical protein
MLDRRAVLLLFSAIALFALSLALPALAVLDKPMFGGDATPRTFPGVICLAMGWLYLPGWLGNPLFFAAAIFHGLRRHRIAIVLLAIALLCSLLAPVILASVRTSLFDFQGVLAGYYVWVASMVVMLIGATRAALRDVDARWALPIESKLE